MPLEKYRKSYIISNIFGFEKFNKIKKYRGINLNSMCVRNMESSEKLEKQKQYLDKKVKICFFLKNFSI